MAFFYRGPSKPGHYEVKVNGVCVVFEITRISWGECRVYIKELPICKNKKRKCDDMSLHLCTESGQRFVDTTRELMRTEQMARDTAAQWVVELLRYYRDGTPITLPREDGLTTT